RRGRRRLRATRAGAGQPGRRDRRATAGAGAADRRLGAGTLRRPARTRTPHRGCQLVNATAAAPRPPASPYRRAAVLMLGSTAAFALMAVTIRLATTTVPTTE